MKFIKFLFISLLFIFSFSFSFAASITVAVTQKDSNQNEIRMISKVIENSIMDVYFDKGFIVTNERIKYWENEKQFEDELRNTKSADYIFSVVVEYKDNSEKIDSIEFNEVKNIKWKILKSMDYSVIAEGEKQNFSEIKNSVESVKKLVKDMSCNVKF